MVSKRKVPQVPQVPLAPNTATATANHTGTTANASVATAPYERVAFLNSTAWKVHDRDLRDAIITGIQAMHDVPAKSLFFPGPQPTSIMREQLQWLRQRRYRVQEKTKGKRGMLALQMINNRPYMSIINRSLDVWIVDDIRALPHLYGTSATTGTLFDGELVKRDDNGRWMYVCFDLVFCTKSVMLDCYSSRLRIMAAVINEMIVDPEAPFDLSTKSHLPLDKLRTLINKVFPQLPYQTDGLIFTPDEFPVQTGTHPCMFKWKPAEEQTVDLLCKVDGTTVRLHCLGGPTLNDNEMNFIASHDFATMFARIPLTLPAHIDNRIVECTWDRVTQLFTAVLCRDDKSIPNHWRVIQLTKQNITENISLEEMIEVSMAM